MQTEFTFGPIDAHPHHEVTVRSGVTRNIVGKFDEIRDEIVEAFNEYIPPSEGLISFNDEVLMVHAHYVKDWLTVPAYETAMHIISRTINRYFIGAPLCKYLVSCNSCPSFKMPQVVIPVSAPSKKSIPTMSLLVLRSSTASRNFSSRKSLDPMPISDLSSLYRFVGKYLTTVPKRTKQAMKYLGPMIDERIELIEQNGRDDPGIPVRDLRIRLQRHSHG
jgi:hypothetical protein